MGCVDCIAAQTRNNFPWVFVKHKFYAYKMALNFFREITPAILCHAFEAANTDNIFSSHHKSPSRGDDQTSLIKV